MSCLLTSNINFCDYSTGGIKSLFLGNKALLGSFNFAGNDEGKVGEFNAESGLFWWLKFDSEEATTAFTETLQDDDRGKIFKQQLALSFIKLEASKRNTLSEMIDGELVAVVEDFNGNYFVIGEECGLKVTNYTGSTDAADGVSSYSLTLEANQLTQAREVPLSTVNGFWVAVEDCSIYAGQPISAIPPPLAVIFDCLIDFSN